jgi:hypothetical protein
MRYSCGRKRMSAIAAWPVPYAIVRVRRMARGDPNRKYRVYCGWKLGAVFPGFPPPLETPPGSLHTRESFRRSPARLPMGGPPEARCRTRGARPRKRGPHDRLGNGPRGTGSGHHPVQRRHHRARLGRVRIRVLRCYQRVELPLLRPLPGGAPLAQETWSQHRIGSCWKRRRNPLKRVFGLPTAVAGSLAFIFQPKFPHRLGTCLASISTCWRYLGGVPRVAAP